MPPRSGITPASTNTFSLRCDGLSHSTLLEVGGASVAQGRVEPVAVVEALQVLEDRAVRVHSCVGQQCPYLLAGSARIYLLVITEYSIQRAMVGKVQVQIIG